MESESNESEIHPPSEEQNTQAAEETIAWVNIFYGMLIAPATTLKVLGNSRIYKTNFAAVLGAFVIFCLCAIVDGFAQGALDKAQPLALIVIVSFASDLMIWLMLAILLSVWARLLKCETSFRSALLVTGWAFVPLIFKAPIVCYNAVGGDWTILLLAIPVIWFFVLELLAFDAILKLGKAKTLGILFVAPPVILIACLFWVMVWAMLACTGP